MELAALLKSTIAVSPQVYWRAVATANNLGVTEANLYDATNVRLRNMQLSYDLPQRFFIKNTDTKSKNWHIM